MFLPYDTIDEERLCHVTCYCSIV